MAGILDSEAYWFVKNFTSSPLLDETTNNHDSDAITNALHYAHAGTNYVQCPNIDNNNVSTPDASKFDIIDDGDLDVRVLYAANDWTPATFDIMVSKLQTSGLNGWEFHLTITTGTLALIMGNGAVRSAESSVATGGTDGVVQGLRVTYDSSAGLANFYTMDSPTITSDLGSASWSLLGDADVVMSGGATTGTASTEDVFIGTRPSGFFPCDGKIYAAQIYDGIAGSIQSDFVADDWTDLTSTYTENSNVWTMNQTGTAEVARIIDKAMFWHDTNALITFPDDPALDFDPTSDVWTYGIGFRTYDTSPGADAALMAKKANFTTGDGYALYLESADATAKGVIADGANSDTDISGNLTAGKAHTLIVRFDGSETEIFLDGTGGGPTATSLAADAANALKLTIGSISGGGSYGQFEWWSACVIPLALSDGEIGTGSNTLHDQLLNQVDSTVITPATVSSPWTLQTVALKASQTTTTVSAPWVKPAPGAVAVLSPGTIGAAWTVPSPSFIGARAAARFKLLADSISRFGLAADETSQLELLADEVTRLELKSE